MGLFDRFKRNEEEETIKADRLVVEDETTDEVEDDDVDGDEPEEFPKESPEDRAENGPFDAEEREAEGAHLDLGALKVPAKPGLGMRLEFDKDKKRLIAVGLDLDGSTLQVQAFAAPRSTGLWHRVRGQFIAQVEKQGGTAQEVESTVGTALRTTVKIVQGADKARNIMLLGVDGPRWFLRGVVSGPAAADDAKLAPLVELFRGVVVDRGSKPIPPGNQLELTVPKAMAEQMQAAAAKQAAAKQAAATQTAVQRNGTPPAAGFRGAPAKDS